MPYGNPLQLQAAPNRSEAKIASQAHSPARHLTEAFRLTEVVHCGEGNHLSAFLTEHPSDWLEQQGFVSSFAYRRLPRKRRGGIGERYRWPDGEPVKRGARSAVVPDLVTRTLGSLYCVRILWRLSVSRIFGGYCKGS